jgi:hypothetical protein
VGARRNKIWDGTDVSADLSAEALAKPEAVPPLKKRLQSGTKPWLIIRGGILVSEASATGGFNDDRITAIDFHLCTTPELLDPLTNSSKSSSPRLPRLTTIYSKWRNPAAVS